MNGSCNGTNAQGERCRSPVVSSGFCIAHGPGGHEEMVKNAKLGGVAKRMRDSSPGQTEDMLPRLVDLVDAPPALDSVRRAVLTRAITHHEGSAAVRAIAEFVKACSALATKQMMDETTKELEKKDKEILELRAQLSGHPRVRVAR